MQSFALIHCLNICLSSRGVLLYPLGCGCQPEPCMVLGMLQINKGSNSTKNNKAHKKAYEEQNDPQLWCQKSVSQAAVGRQRFLCCKGCAPFCCSQDLSCLLRFFSGNEDDSRKTDQIQQTKPEKIQLLSWISSAFLIIPYILNLIPAPKSPICNHC